jgi:sugar O-acyltransferase (sialic acid O-acetyltransferase NeuD family)
MEQIYVFGNSGFAREVAILCYSTGKYEVVAFVENDDHFDANSAVASYGSYTTPVITESSFEDQVKASNKKALAVIAIASGKICRKIYEKFKAYCDFPNIVHPNAKVSTDVKMGIGNVFYCDSWISCMIEMGSFNKYLNFVTIGHECVIGDYNEFNPKASISGCVHIGDSNLFGAGSIVYQGLRIGSNNTIGLGAIIVRKIKDEETWFGNPAEKL